MSRRGVSGSLEHVYCRESAKKQIILCALLFSAVLLALALADSSEAEAAAKASGGLQAQALTLDKHKRRKDPPEEQEAQFMPWAHKLDGITVTYYDCCVECCGKDDSLTYSGTLAVPYETCAVDPDVIPLGSDVTVDYGDGELHHYRAEDVGGGVKGSRIDICVSSHEEALKLGVKEATVYWMEVENEGTGQNSFSVQPTG